LSYPEAISVCENRISRWSANQLSSVFDVPSAGTNADRNPLNTAFKSF
jgi:hypothetical protein